MSREVDVELVPTARIAAPTWDEIWHLTRAFYESERAYIEGSLKQRQQVALVRRRANRELVGMASMDVIVTTFEGRTITAIYTSHVLLLEEFRGLNLIQRIGFKAYLSLRLRHPFRVIYWFFDTFSYKSYLLLPKNFRVFWPRHDRPTPQPVKALIDHLAKRLYGSNWQPDTGLVAASGRKRLKSETAPLTPSVVALPDAAFFLRANPGHAEGSMLVCLCPLSAVNWFCAGVRALKRAHGK